MPLMRKPFAGLVLLATALVGCGEDKPPNQQACEMLRDNQGGSEAERRENFDRAAELAEGELKQPMRFISDFAEQNPQFFEEGYEPGLEDMASLGPIFEAFTKITAECAKVGVALPMD
jgi:hypothetical protein